MISTQDWCLLACCQVADMCLVNLQISNVAEHPAPPFAFPMAPGAAAGVGAGAAESSSAAGRHVQKSKRSDLEMGALPSAAAGGVALSPSRKPPARCGLLNPLCCGCSVRGQVGICNRQYVWTLTLCTTHMIWGARPSAIVRGVFRSPQASEVSVELDHRLIFYASAGWQALAVRTTRLLAAG